MYTWTDGTDVLMHHGIKGQKWGLRRFQNPDGSLTEEGRKRYGVNSYKKYVVDKATSVKNRIRNIDKDKIKKIGKYAAIATAVGVSSYLVLNNKELVADTLKKVGGTAVNELKESFKRAGQASLDAALITSGTITINKIAEKLPTDDSVDEATRNKNQLLYDSAKAGIEAATNANVSSKNNKNKTTVNVGKNITDKLGSPTNKGIDRSSVEYQSLFKDSRGNNRDADVRAAIKSLAASGYDIDQLQKYVDGIDNGSIKHSAEEIGMYITFSLLTD